MRRRLVVLLLLCPFTVATGSVKEHTDYVPDDKTAEQVAEAILVGQFGRDRVSAQLPLHADGSSARYWIVQGAFHKEGIPNKGGAFGVWINKHSGCITNVVEHMK